MATEALKKFADELNAEEFEMMKEYLNQIEMEDGAPCP